MKRSLPRLALASFTVALLAATACARHDVPIGADCRSGFCADPAQFIPSPDAGPDGATEQERSDLLMCIGTACPEPYATCSPTARCGANLKNDPENCGACGVSCTGFRDLHLSASCVDGACVFQCSAFSSGQLFRNCNGFLDDGCEIDVANDPENCGVCGNRCAPGVGCVEGFCGCFAPEVECGGECIDTRNDDMNCSACGKICETPQERCNPMPARSRYGCVGGSCGRLKCVGPFADCNGDLTGCNSDGCETNIRTPDNCGGCGIKCGPGQECRPDPVDGRLHCEPTCASAGLAQCGSRCRDLLNDPTNCGACGVGCFGGGWGNQVAVCKKGICSVECLPGFADCNGDPNDGCESVLASDAANCGACGVQCNVAAGQPCIEGKCLMVECDAGVETK